MKVIAAVYQYLKYNTSIQHIGLYYPRSITVDLNALITDCFSTNTTILRSSKVPPLVQWYIDLNNVCQQVGVGSYLRKSVPEGKMKKQKMEIFLKELKHRSEPWKTMKIVVLGHGQVGKTTLLEAIRAVLTSTIPSVCYLFCKLLV